MKNQFSLTRQTYNTDDVAAEIDPPVGDLIGLYFPPIWNFANAAVEVIECEWIAGSYISATSGTVTTSDDYQYSITDVSDYDYVLLPNSKKGTSTVYSGMCSGAGTALNPRGTISAASGYTDSVFGYMLLPVDSTNYYAAVSILANTYQPVLGIKVAS